ncbi:MAG: Gfo/Idh/MocA family oxidoreductase [Actinomycetota bacterium]|nr:Gfo/Idh/MocA family oxidoreductase [Actinomycetota bacterium]
MIAATDGLAVASVVTSSAERQALVAREHPDAQILTSPVEQCERAGDHDLVVVATPNHSHAPLATEAIDRGLHVVVDKPLAMSSEEAQALVSRAALASRVLTVFQNRRWDADQLTLARLLAEDRLGTILRYESRFERWRPSANADSWRDSTPPERGGGQLLDLDTHLVDQALVLGTKAAFVVRELDGQEDALRSGSRPGRGREPVNLYQPVRVGKRVFSVIRAVRQMGPLPDRNRRAAVWHDVWREAYHCLSAGRPQGSA